MDTVRLGNIDYVILVIYMLFVLGIGFALKRYMKTSTDFFLSGRSIPAWIAALAFVSANLGANEVIGMGACGAKYGMMTCHFYWLGAVAAMVFVGLFMMPFYYGSKARSVPEYLKLRFDEKTRGFNAISFAVMTIFMSGISMYALAVLFQTLLNWPFGASIWISAIIVLVYIFLGGLTSAIYNEVLQFFLIVIGFLPLVILGLWDIGGWDGLTTKLAEYAKNAPGQHYDANAWTSVWANMGSSTNNPMHVEWVGMTLGLGFVLAFGYWCTDFLVVQRAMAAESMSAARRTPILATIPKIMIPAIVIIPGMIALVAKPHPGVFPDTYQTNPPQAGDAVEERIAPPFQGLIPPKIETKIEIVDGVEKKVQRIKADREGKVELDYDKVMPMMLVQYFPTGLLGLGLTALMASFMSGMAGNVTAFNTVWTYDIYQSYLAPNRSDTHYLWIGRATTVVGILLSIAAAYLAASFNNIMDFIQLVFGFVNAPLFATFLLGMFWKRTTGHGAFFGLLAGTLASAMHTALTGPTGHWLVNAGLLGKPIHEYGSDMAQNFWMAIYSWTTCFVATVAISLATPRTKTDDELRGLVYSLTPRFDHDDHLAWYAKPETLAVVMLAVTIALNIIFW
ncbi:MAG: sodium:solute symporter family protein [Pirellulales bacterium]|nr:sodium:solute symporter family protein [Pirellulales bacterium]